MTALRILGIVLIVAGAAGLSYKQISYTKQTHTAKIGGLELSVDEKERFAIPTWLSGGVIAIGVGLLLLGGRKA